MSVLCYGFARLVTFSVTFWVENRPIFDGKIGVNTRKRFVFSRAEESPPLRQISLTRSSVETYRLSTRKTST